MGSLAEFERDLTSERTKAGLEAARARGRRGGRPTVMTPQKVKVARDLRESGVQRGGDRPDSRRQSKNGVSPSRPVCTKALSDYPNPSLAEWFVGEVRAIRDDAVPACPRRPESHRKAEG